MSAYVQHIEKIHKDLMETALDVSKKTFYADFFIEDKVNVVNIQHFFPELANAKLNDEQAVIQRITSLVHDYAACNFFEKIWWRLTSSMDAYITLHDIVTLSAMKDCLAEGDFAASHAIYKNSAMISLVSFWDVLFSSWRQILDGMASHPPKPSVPLPAPAAPAPAPIIMPVEKKVTIRATLDEQEAKLKAFECTVNNAFIRISMNAVDKDFAINSLKSLRKDLLIMLREVHPDKNTQEHEQEKVANLTIRMNEIKSKIDEEIEFYGDDNSLNLHYKTHILAQNVMQTNNQVTELMESHKDVQAKQRVINEGLESKAKTLESKAKAQESTIQGLESKAKTQESTIEDLKKDNVALNARVDAILLMLQQNNSEQSGKKKPSGPEFF